MHTSPEWAQYQCLAIREKRFRSRHRAFPHHEEPPQGGVSNGEFAQNEDEFDVPSTAYLILSEVEGRTTPMHG
jgi:hypothetical protein